MPDCKWMQDGICVNADCPMCCEYCPVAILVGLRVEAGHMVQRQYFESVEAARRAAERWWKA